MGSQWDPCSRVSPHTSCRSQDSNSQPWVTSGFKSNVLSTRPQLPFDAFDNPHKAVVLSVGCASFSSTLFPSTQLSVNMLGYSTLWRARFFGNECLWLSLLVKGVNDCLLDNCQISSLPHDCVAYWTKLRDHFEGSGNLCRCFELICWFTILLICWDSELAGLCLMWATMITIKRTKDLNYFSLRALNLFNTEFHNLSWITETNELFHDILIYWD